MKKLICVLFALMMLITTAVPAFAAESPTAATFAYTIEILPSGGGAGSYDRYTDDDGNECVHLIAKPYSGYVFDHWVIDGPYTTDGKLTDAELDIIITGDVDATPVFRKQSDSSLAPTIDKDDSPTSPQTGTNPLAFYGMFATSVAICGVGVIRILKSKQDEQM